MTTKHANNACCIAESYRQGQDNSSHATDTHDTNKRNNKDNDTYPFITKPHKTATNHDLMQPWSEWKTDLALCKDADDARRFPGQPTELTIVTPHPVSLLSGMFLMKNMSSLSWRLPRKTPQTTLPQTQCHQRIAQPQRLHTPRQ